jgi:hypothetical protein
MIRACKSTSLRLQERLYGYLHFAVTGNCTHYSLEHSKQEKSKTMWTGAKFHVGQLSP